MAITADPGECFYCGARVRQVWRHDDTPAPLCRAHYRRTWVYGHPSLEAWLRLQSVEGTIIGLWARRERQWRTRDRVYHATYRMAFDRAVAEAGQVLADELQRETPRIATPWVVGVFAHLTPRQLEVLCRRIVLTKGWLWSASDPTPPDAVKTPGHLQASLAAWLLRNAHFQNQVGLTWNKSKLEGIFTAMRHCIARMEAEMKPAILAFRVKMAELERRNQARPQSGEFVPGHRHIWKNSGIRYERRSGLWAKKITLSDYRLQRAARRAGHFG